MYKGIDFKRIISDYPKSNYADDCAYEFLLESRNFDWEGDYRDMLPRIDRCKKFLESYPESNLRKNVIGLCLNDYSDIIRRSWKLPDSLKTKYQMESDKFAQRWKRDEKE